SATASERRAEEKAKPPSEAASRSGDRERAPPARGAARPPASCPPLFPRTAGPAQAIMANTAMTESQKPTSKIQPGSTARITAADQQRVWRGRGACKDASTTE